LSLFVRFRKKPVDLQLLDAVIPRLPPNYQSVLPRLKNAASRLQKGYAGEKKLDYHLHQLSKNFTVIPDVTLRWKQQPFQMDSLVISPHAIHIISVKSLEGSITFDLQQRILIQESRGHVQRYECPITQVERHKAFLMKWFDQQKLIRRPIYYWIAIAETATQIKVNPSTEKIPPYIDYVENIPYKIEQMEANNKHHHPLDTSVIAYQTKMIVNHTEDFQTNLLKKYKIKLADLRKGVLCRTCYRLETIYRYGKIHCKNCGRVPTADILATLDQFMLLHKISTIKNEQIMHWLQINNRHQTLRLIKNIGLQKVPNCRKWQLENIDKKSLAKVE